MSHEEYTNNPILQALAKIILDQSRDMVRQLLQEGKQNLSTGTHTAHSPDFATVRVGDTLYHLTPKQRIVVATLWEATENGTPELSGAYLLETANSDQCRMAKLFVKSPAWMTLIVRGSTSGTYRLNLEGALTV